MLDKVWRAIGDVLRLKKRERDRVSVEVEER